MILGTPNVGTIHIIYDAENWFYECFLEAYSTKCQYPDISEPIQGRVKKAIRCTEYGIMGSISPLPCYICTLL